MCLVLRVSTYVLLWTGVSVSGVTRCQGEVLASATDGFMLRIQRTTKLAPAECVRTIVHDVSKWYDASHSYSGDPANLSMDLEKHAFLEKLPGGGFVRHLEIVYYDPAKLLRLSGGLGPLQEMGVQGALTFKCEQQNGSTQITLVYHVHGFSHLQLDKLAPIVERVLSGQMDRLEGYCRKRETR